MFKVISAVNEKDLHRVEFELPLAEEENELDITVLCRAQMKVWCRNSQVLLPSASYGLGGNCNQVSEWRPLYVYTRRKDQTRFRLLLVSLILANSLALSEKIAQTGIPSPTILPLGIIFFLQQLILIEVQTGFRCNITVCPSLLHSMLTKSALRVSLPNRPTYQKHEEDHGHLD